MPIYLQPYYQKLGFKPGYLPKAEKYYSEAISIPVYSTITKEQVQRVCDVLKDIL
jgi:dTDP-4-amino-4,6-dideoxygalactose transaminase